LNKKLVLSGLTISVMIFSLILSSLPANAQGPDFVPGKTEVVLALGKVPGQDLYAHVWIVVPADSDRNSVVNESLKNQGLKPIHHSDFSLTGMHYSQFFDGDNSNDFLVQNYNPSNDPTGDGYATLKKTHDTWSSVANQNFTFEDGGTTDRCPSLVRECPGKQFSDANNDVAWMPIKDRNTLGVTWYNTNTQEADMALNTNFSWSTNGASGTFDVETVYLHENGHVLGLSHSDVSGAVMEPVYAGVRQSLHQDDICGIQTIYGDAQGCGTQPTEPVNPQPGNASFAYVTYGLNHGKMQVNVDLRDNENNPVPNTSVTIIVSSDSATSGSTTKTTNDNGIATWNFRGVPGGYYTTQVTHVDGNPWLGETIDFGFLK
jgi:hypothetical protein